MAHQRLGHKDQARACLAQAKSKIDAHPPSWPEDVQSQHLRREAEDLIEGTAVKDQDSEVK